MGKIKKTKFYFSYKADTGKRIFGLRKNLSYSYVDKKGKKIKVTRYKQFSEKTFKHYIQSKRYIVKEKDVNVKVIQYRDNSAIETPSPYKRSKRYFQYRILAFYEGLTSTSHFAKTPPNRTKNDALKEDAVRKIAMQIVGIEKYDAPTPPDTESAENESESKLHELLNDMDNIEFKWLYYTSK